MNKIAIFFLLFTLLMSCGQSADESHKEVKKTVNKLEERSRKLQSKMSDSFEKLQKTRSDSSENRISGEKLSSVVRDFAEWQETFNEVKAQHSEQHNHSNDNDHEHDHSQNHNNISAKELLEVLEDLDKRLSEIENELPTN